MKPSIPPLLRLPLLVLLAATAAGVCFADGGVTFHDFAARQGSGIDYHRTPSEILSTQRRFEQLPALNMGHVIASPEKPRGAPGVALIDFDRDGDLDVYVPNGPGSANSLFSNQLVESGVLSFKDVARQAGVEAVEQDSTGVCFGDTDNDGDPDLLVLGRSEPNRFFENRGDGTFVEVSGRSGLGGGTYGHASCNLGDYDNDGLLDVVIANSFDWSSRQAVFNVPYAMSHPNQLFHNLGDNRFADVSESSGMRKITSVRPAIDQGATMSWAVALLDYDMDGVAELFHADDQAALSPEQADRAHVHVYENDGTGRFKNVTHQVGTDVWGAWMGLAFADFNCDGAMDFFASNWGDYAFAPIGFPFQRGQWSSRWFLGRGDGTFSDPGVGELKATPFGWSAMALDYDNDADTDVIYLGNLGTAIYTMLGDNPGAVLQNQGCSAHFRRDAEAMTTNHSRRIVEGAAAGDLNGDGFPDVVSVSSHDVPPEVKQTPYGLDYGSPFDATAVYTAYMEPAPGGNFVPKGLQFPDGGLVIDLNSGDNGNGWAAVRTLGAVGLVRGAKVNRDGIGAILRFTPEGKATAMRPVLGGSNYASEDSLEVLFGFGDAKSGVLEVFWPGGVRNRLYGVASGERVLVPEIPCGYDAEWSGEGAYGACVEAALSDLRKAGVLRATESKRWKDSALRAYEDFRATETPDGAAPDVREPRPRRPGTEEGSAKTGEASAAAHHMARYFVL